MLYKHNDVLILSNTNSAIPRKINHFIPIFFFFKKNIMMESRSKIKIAIIGAGPVS